MLLIDQIIMVHFHVSTGGMGQAGEISFKMIEIRLKKVDVKSLKASSGVREPEY